MAGSGLLSLDQARSAISAPAGDTSMNAELEFYVAALTPVMEDVVGSIQPRVCDEWHDGGATSVVLLHPPLLAVASVTEHAGSVAYPLTEQDLGASSSFDAYGFTVDLDSGDLYRRSSGSLVAFAVGRRNVHVVYTAGREVVAPNIVLATRVLLKHQWQLDKQGARPAFGTAEASPTVVTPSGFAVPRRVVELCGAESRIQGSA